MTEVLDHQIPTAENYQEVYSGLIVVRKGNFSTVQGNIHSGVIRLEQDGETQRWEQVIPTTLSPAPQLGQDSADFSNRLHRYEQGRLAEAVSYGLSDNPDPFMLKNMSMFAKQLRGDADKRPYYKAISEHARGIEQEIVALRESTAYNETTKLNTMVGSHQLLVLIESYGFEKTERRLARLAGFALQGNGEEGFSLVTLIQGSQNTGLVPPRFRAQGLYRKTKYRRIGESE